jgi:flagellar assembly factor FliW
MTIETTRFGEVEISEGSILQMPEGMLGFRSLNRFVLLEDRPDTPFKWLQSVDDPSLAFIVVNPMDFFSDYDIEISDDDAESLGLADPTQAAIVTTVTIDKNEGLITTNLLGPIVINSKTLMAKQIVLQDEKYGTKHTIGTNGSENVTLEIARAA